MFFLHVVPTQTISSQGGLSAGIISVIVVAAVMVLLMLVIVALIVVVTLKHKANKQLRYDVYTMYLLIFFLLRSQV